MTISVQHFLETKAKPMCCGFFMHRSPKFILLREPPVAFRFMGYTCQVCKRTGVNAADIKSNQHRALRAAARVHPPHDLFTLMKKDQNENQRSGKKEAR